MPALVPIRFGSSPEGTPKRPLVLGSASAPPFSCVTADIFLARTSGLDVLHQNAYKQLICGLVDDGIWTSLEVLHVYATQDSVTALLNLVQNLYNGVAHGTPLFTADRGFTGGASGGSTVFIDTGFAPMSGAYLQNDAHMSAWNLVSAASPDAVMGCTDAAQIFWNNTLNTRYVDDHFYARVNSLPSSPGSGAVVASGAGHFLGNRISSSLEEGYQNGIGVISTASTSAAPNNNIYTLAYNRGATAFGGPNQLAMASIGASLTPTQAANFYNRLRTYMTTVGVP